MSLSNERLTPFLPQHDGRITGDERGIAMMEFIIMLPVLILLMCAVAEFGWYFVRYEALNRALSLTSESIVNMGGLVTQAVANDTGSGLIPFGANGNYICAQAYQTNANALAAKPHCTNGTWALGNKFGFVTCADTGITCTTPYYVGIVANASSFSLTGFVSTILPNGTSVTQSIVVPVSSNSIPTCPFGQTLISDGHGWICGASGTFGGAFMGQAQTCGNCATSINSYMGTTTYVGTTKNQCEYSNPLTNACSCPAGYTAYPIWDYITAPGNLYSNLNGVAAIWICLP